MLAFYTTTELIEELSKRTTFAGVVFQSDKEVKGGETHQSWDVTYCNLTAQQVHDLLKDAVEHFRQLAQAE